MYCLTSVRDVRRRLAKTLEKSRKSEPFEESVKRRERWQEKRGEGKEDRETRTKKRNNRERERERERVG